MIETLHNLSRTKKKIIITLLDVFFVLFSLYSAFILRSGEMYYPLGNEKWLWLISPLVALPIFYRFGLSRSVIEHVDFRALWTIAKAVSLYSLALGMVLFISRLPIPRSVILIHWPIAIVLVAGSRIMGRWLFSQGRQQTFLEQPTKSRGILIYGAGASGVQIARSLYTHSGIHPTAFIDDDKNLHKQIVSGLVVYSPDEVERLVKDHEISEILLAMPSATRARTREIITKLKPLSVKLRTLPTLSEIVEGTVKFDDIRDVSIEDLLGRQSVQPDEKLLSSNLAGKVVMVTGAGGSIGSELCRQIIKVDPDLLILYEQSEYALYALEKELKDQQIKCIPILGSVLDQSRVERVCKHFSVQTIYHAAAYKHVPLVEVNPAIGVNNNVMGTLNTAKAAIATNVETFVLISTDKAVRPTNVMGASKRLAELVLQGLHQQGKEDSTKTRFTMVRFGNVLGSSGSVVPYFQEQIKKGGPVTVTHKDIIRYFMTIPEAAQLVIQAGALGEGGDVFVLDMGEPVRIVDLARNMIQLSGLDVQDEDNPDGDIEIQFTGLRPGEKLYEELLIGDNVIKTSHPLIMRAEEEIMPWDELQKYLEELHFVYRDNDARKVRDVLLRAVKGYSPQCDVVDLLSEDKDVGT